MKKILILCCCIYLANVSNAQLHIGVGTSWNSTPETYVVLDSIGLRHESLSAPLDNIFKFTGQKDVSITGGSTPLFKSIILALTASSRLILQRSISISDHLTFQSGILDLNNNNIDLGSTGLLIGESGNSRILDAKSGYIQIINSLNGPVSANPGNLGAIITSSQNLGSTIIRRSHYSRPIAAAGGSSITRTFQISPTNSSGLNATLRLAYFDEELNGLDENSLVFWRSPDEITWADEGFTTKDPVNNFVEKTGINSFSSWTLSRVSAPLPVVFLLFNARCMNNTVILNWRTSQEINSRKFSVERSPDGNNWAVIGGLTAAGISSTQRNYSLTDNTPLAAGYYRIAEHDIDGRITYTSVIHSDCGTLSDWKTWPNPVRDQFWINLTAANDSKITIKLFDSKGSLLFQQQNDLLRGTNLLPVEMRKLPSGTYHIMASWDNGRKEINDKIIKL